MAHDNQDHRARYFKQDGRAHSSCAELTSSCLTGRSFESKTPIRVPKGKPFCGLGGYDLSQRSFVKNPDSLCLPTTEDALINYCSEDLDGGIIAEVQRTNRVD